MIRRACLSTDITNKNETLPSPPSRESVTTPPGGGEGGWSLDTYSEILNLRLPLGKDGLGHWLGLQSSASTFVAAAAFTARGGTTCIRIWGEERAG